MAMPRAKVATAEGNRQSKSSCTPSRLLSQGPPQCITQHTMHCPKEGSKRSRQLGQWLCWVCLRKILRGKAEESGLNRYLLPQPGMSLTAAQRDHVTPRSSGSSVLNAWGQTHHKHTCASTCLCASPAEAGHVRKPSHLRLCSDLTSCCVSHSHCLLLSCESLLQGQSWKLALTSSLCSVLCFQVHCQALCPVGGRQACQT